LSPSKTALSSAGCENSLILADVETEGVGASTTNGLPACSGPLFVSFLSRASNVSKARVRCKWTLGDMRWALNAHEVAAMDKRACDDWPGNTPAIAVDTRACISRSDRSAGLGSDSLAATCSMKCQNSVTEAWEPIHSAASKQGLVHGHEAWRPMRAPRGGDDSDAHAQQNAAMLSDNDRMWLSRAAIRRGRQRKYLRRL
jgi:hypothetical protein